MPKTLADLTELFGARRRMRPAEALPVEILLDRDIVPDPPPPGRATLSGIGEAALDCAIERAASRLLSLQRPDGHFCAELEANGGLSAQWILCRRYVGLADRDREQRLIRYLRSTQQADGGWCLYHGAPSDVATTCQVYFAAKLAGHHPDEPWLARARELIRARGGVESSSVINKIYLALFGQYDWAGVPSLPVSVMFMPRGMAFNIYEMAYWARTCVIPLLILCWKKKEYPTPPAARIDELYVTPRERLEHRIEKEVPTFSWRNFFLQADRVLKAFEKVPIEFHREKAARRAEQWILEHQDQDGSWGGIFPAMTHSVMALYALGYPTDRGPVRRGLEAIAALEIAEGDTIRVQPCVSPVWDTAWAVIALAKAGLRRDDPRLRSATDWLYARQIRKPGDWSVKCPGVTPGGWAFQYHNDCYPDTDDTSTVLIALLNSHYRDDPAKKEAFEIGIQWLLGLQNDDGGWGAFERDVDNEIYDEILFNDAKNMLDPSTVDVSGRCLEVLGKLGYPRTHKAVARGLRYLRKEQESDGKWWGRWGVNYIYGTWSALCGLAAVKEPPESPIIARGAAFLERTQRPEGSWGESCASYEGGAPGVGAGTASQTAWAVMGLLAAGRGSGQACRRGIGWLLEAQRPNGEWDEREFTGTGFPGVFYLRYHYYRLYFPLLALARYRAMAR